MLLFLILFCLTVNASPISSSSRAQISSEAIRRRVATLLLRTINVDKAVSNTYDFIVVGGGAAGCPLARTLAESGKSVLMIERGGSRLEYPRALDIYGSGIVIDDPEINQLVITTEGVRSHLASVLSGGTATNMGILIDDSKAFLDMIEQFPGVSFNRTLLENATRWTENWAAYEMPETRYGVRRKGVLEQIYGPNRGFSYELKIDTSWRAASMFDSQSNWFRVGSDNSLGVQGQDYPPSLKVLLRQNVHRVIFEKGSAPNTLRAICVDIAATTAEDIAPIGSDKASGQSPRLFGVGSSTPKAFVSRLPDVPMKRVCVKRGGQIILAAGTLLDPIILYKSGVGPRSAVLHSGAELIYEMAELGQNIRDRVYIPIGLFFKDLLPKSGFPPRICQDVGIANMGPDCERFHIGDRNLGCTAATIEELSGARISEGVIYATRYVVPPSFRHHPVMAAIFQVVEDCAENRLPMGSLLLRVLCPLARPMITCFRKAAANLFFTANPKSMGHMEILENGEVSITANYLVDPQERQDAARGLSEIIKVTNSDEFKDFFEPAGLRSCPATIINGLLAFLESQFLRNSSISGLSANVSTPEEVKKFLTEQLSDFKKQKKHVESLNQINATVSKEAEGESIFGSLTSFLHQQQWISQKYATYPPALPEASDYEGLMKFASLWMTSMWHWVGTAAMGAVVDSNFLLKGTENLRIVDAAVLPQLTRMNPLLFVLALGRYGGLLILQNSTTSASLPPPPLL